MPIDIVLPRLNSYDIIWNHNQKEKLEVEFDVESAKSDYPFLMCYKFVYKLGTKGPNSKKILLDELNYAQVFPDPHNKRDFSFNVKLRGTDTYSMILKKFNDSPVKVSTSRTNFSIFISKKVKNGDFDVKTTPKKDLVPATK